MKKLFRSPGLLSWGLSLAFIAMMALSTYQVAHAASAAAVSMVVLSSTGLLAVMLGTGLDQMAAALKALQEPRVGIQTSASTSLSPPLTHRQHLERGAVPSLVAHALSGGDGTGSGKLVRAALDALMGRSEPVVLPDSFAPAAAVDVESMIRSAGLTAPRVKPEDLEANIVHTEIVTHVAPSGQILRWAVLTTQNGFAVTGRPSASVSAENDRPEIGKSVAIENARNELWPLMGYELRSQLAT